MSRDRKSTQLQIRVSEAQKAALRSEADRAGMSMSDWVLSRVFPPARETFQKLVGVLSTAEEPGAVLAELNELLTRLSSDELEQAVSEPPRARLDPFRACYLAAMIEQAAARKNTRAPGWTEDVPSLTEPVFGSALESLRLHLLTHSPLPFRRRNIFIDSSIGDRV
jgi:uncharacterized protein (DUF1778 family)